MGFGVWGLGFGVWGLGFGVWGLGFGVWGLGFGVWGRFPASGVPVWGALLMAEKDFGGLRFRVRVGTLFNVFPPLISWKGHVNPRQNSKSPLSPLQASNSRSIRV